MHLLQAITWTMKRLDYHLRYLLICFSISCAHGRYAKWKRGRRHPFAHYNQELSTILTFIRTAARYVFTLRVGVVLVIVFTCLDISTRISQEDGHVQDPHAYGKSYFVFAYIYNKSMVYISNCIVVDDALEEAKVWPFASSCE